MKMMMKLTTSLFRIGRWVHIISFAISFHLLSLSLSQLNWTRARTLSLYIPVLVIERETKRTGRQSIESLKPTTVWAGWRIKGFRPKNYKKYIVKILLFFPHNLFTRFFDITRNSNVEKCFFHFVPSVRLFPFFFLYIFVIITW